MSKTSMVISLIIVFLFSMNGTVFGEENTQSVSLLYDYVSLGDSLAAGQTPYGNNDSYGYTNIIVNKLADAGVLGGYGDYGVSGWTTQNVLNQVTTDTDVQYALNNAEIVTLDIGANDIFRVIEWANQLSTMTPQQTLQTYPGSMETAELQSLLISSKTLEQKITAILGIEITAVQFKLEKIIQAIKACSPDTKIYVMGYYNALPDMPQFLPLLEQLNDKIRLAATSNGATYVATQASMNKHLTKYLPGDVHPTVQGYRTIAQDFWGFIQTDFLRGLN
ncbi:SGNH/GDSL hydrolase family protein [Clostridium algoriphilum]|uniref:SGNH/GDSL hydrolase family protein n=1 Tax=Clostridium algoriphilum TaxID=198347 RepID=UPI001CF0FCC4|nr:SGNH/GDSL hydrolase family protein [Clostridium algoriphilum]MCB2295938.1 SGNH/GDSL hydrolase family protein [Clostridium algoriphilum]